MTIIDRKHFGQFLSQNRKKRAQSQQNISKKLGYSSPQFISNIERGYALPPDLFEWGRAYGVSNNELIEAYLQAVRIELVRMQKSKSKSRSRQPSGDRKLGSQSSSSGSESGSI